MPEINKPNQKHSIRAVIGLVNGGKKYPAVSLVNSNPEIAATLSKLVQAREKPLFGIDSPHAASTINRNDLSTISQEVAEKTRDAENIMQLFPDTELASQILISSIISPKDMTSTEIIYTSNDKLLSSEITSALLAKIKDRLETDYSIKSLCPVMLREVLFESGSYPMVVIPESSVDELINGTSKISTESISEYVNHDGSIKPYGVLGDPLQNKTKLSNLAFESFTEYKINAAYTSVLTGTNIKNERVALEQFNVNIIDNPMTLKLPQVLSRIKTERINSIFKSNIKLKTFAFENNVTNLSKTQLQSLIYKNKNKEMTQLVKVKTAEQAQRKSVGKPLIMRLPSESVIPVYVPGNEKKHIGYFVLIDNEGNPLTMDSNSNYFNDLQSKVNNQNSTMSSYLLQRAKNGLQGNQPQELTIDQAALIYADIVESDLLERLRTGVYGNNVSVAKNDELYRIMLARTFANQMTQLLYLPEELVTYFAYKYGKNGIGKSLHDDMRILSSLRAMTLFARVMASLKNSIGRTKVNFKLDEEDIDPQKTIEVGMHEIAKTRQQYFPLGLNSPTDLVDWVQRSGFEFAFEGHPKIPDVKIDFSEVATNYTKPDTELDEELKKSQIMGFGLSPESVDNGFTAEFATTVVSNNLLLAKRVIQIQDHVGPLISDHARKIVKNDGSLIEDLRGIVSENFEKIKESIAEKEELDPNTDKEEVIDILLSNFIDNFHLALPQPNSITLENQMMAFDKYAEALDKALEAYINTNIINSDMSGNISNNIDNFKAIIKAYYLRKFMADNNILTELSELTTNDEMGNPVLNLFDIQEQHITGIVRSGIKLYAKTTEVKTAADKDIESITNGEGIQESSSGNTSEEQPAEDDTSGEEDAGGGADVGEDLPDLGGVE